MTLPGLPGVARCEIGGRGLKLYRITALVILLAMYVAELTYIEAVRLAKENQE